MSDNFDLSSNDTVLTPNAKEPDSGAPTPSEPGPESPSARKGITENMMTQPEQAHQMRVTRFASEPVAELVNEPHNPIDPGTAYVRLTLLGTTLHLSIADAVSTVDEIACALAGVTP